MLPIFGSTIESDTGRNDSRRRNLKVGLPGLMAMLLLGIILMSSGNVTAAIAGGTTFVIAIIALAVLVVTGGQRENDTAKRKRGLDGLDMYSLIDRIVDDLDEDELAYLRRRLEHKDNELPQQLNDLLDHRAEERLAGRR